MKIFTKPFITFLVLATLFTLTFRILLSNFLLNQSAILVWITAIIYGLVMFATGYFTGRSGNNEFSSTQSFLKWNGGTFIIFGSISYLWMFYGNSAPSESISTLNTMLIIWAIISIIVYLMIKHSSIKGIEKSEIFN